MQVLRTYNVTLDMVVSITFIMLVCIQCRVVRGLVQSLCKKINIIMTLGGEGILVHNVLYLHCQQT